MCVHVKKLPSRSLESTLERQLGIWKRECLSQPLARPRRVREHSRERGQLELNMGMWTPWHVLGTAISDFKLPGFKL